MNYLLVQLFACYIIVMVVRKCMAQPFGQKLCTSLSKRKINNVASRFRVAYSSMLFKIRRVCQRNATRVTHKP